jgi:xylan 1,4-beta-xylosidase
MNSNRREAIKKLLVRAALPSSLVNPTQATVMHGASAGQVQWERGVENQRQADRNNGTYLNPVLSGDRPDPTVLKDGKNYYMTFSSFTNCPGIVIWRSRDLVNWSPVGPALSKPVGNVWAMDLIKHQGRYFIYIPADPNGRQTILVIWADSIKGPWSDPVDLRLEGCIDPGHIVGEDGKRYLFVNGIRRVRLSDGGLSTDGPLEPAYSPWQYPKEWVVEMYAPEGPKLFKRGCWFYLVSAVGGTSGPPTGHMVIAARSRSVHGPWEHCPHNPLVRTRSEDEMWWSRGHATMVEGPKGDWWMVYHGYENGFRTLGRQCLLEPVEWTEDGWFKPLGGDLSQPLPIPARTVTYSRGFPLSDDFSTDKFGPQWSFYQPAADEMQRAQRDGRGLVIAGKGNSPANCSPLTFTCGDPSYETTVTMDIGEEGEGGFLLFYNERMFVGLGFTTTHMKTFNYGEEHVWLRTEMPTSTVTVKCRNVRNVVTFFYSHDGATWTQHPWQMEVSGMHHNVLGGFLSLRPSIYSSGTGKVRVRTFRYRALAA